MTTSQQNLQKLIDLYRLRELYILKDNIGLEFSNMHFNKPARKIQHRMDLLVKDKINHRVDGTGLKYNKYELLEGIVDGALKQQTRTLVKQPNKFTRHALKDNTKNYEKFFQKRLNIEDTRIDLKIEEAIKSLQKEKLTDTELKKMVYNKVEGTGTSKLQNIIRDSLHTNQARLSFTKALEDGYKYKIWKNGRIIGYSGGKKNKNSRTRPWHIESKIQPVLLEDMFDIYGSYHAQLMYPGDLNGGAENVANCKCWLYYTDTRPTGFKRKGNANTNYHDVFNKKDKQKQNKPPSKKNNSKNNVVDTLKNIKNKISLNFFNSNESKSNNNFEWKKLSKKKIPSNFDDSLKKSLLNFDKHKNLFKDGNEWAQVYNKTEGQFEKITSDKKRNQVNPINRKDYGDDELIINHNHPDNSPLSIADIGKAILAQENIINVSAHTKSQVYILFLNEGIDINNEKQIEKIGKKLSNIYANEIFRNKRYYDSEFDALVSVLDKSVANDILKQYIEKYEVIDK